MTDDLDKLKCAPEDQDAALFDRVAEILDAARSHVSRTVNTTMVQAYWLIGREIVEVEQGGEARAGYGDEVVKRLSRRMTAGYGKGFTSTSIKRMRQFYLAFPTGSRLPELVSGVDKDAAPRHLSPARPLFPPQLSWTHYRKLLTIDNEGARAFPLAPGR